MIYQPSDCFCTHPRRWAELLRLVAERTRSGQGRVSPHRLRNASRRNNRIHFGAAAAGSRLVCGSGRGFPRSSPGSGDAAGRQQRWMDVPSNASATPALPVLNAAERDTSSGVTVSPGCCAERRHTPTRRRAKIYSAIGRFALCLFAHSDLSP